MIFCCFVCFLFPFGASAFTEAVFVVFTPFVPGISWYCSLGFPACFVVFMFAFAAGFYVCCRSFAVCVFCLCCCCFCNFRSFDVVLL